MSANNAAARDAGFRPALSANGLAGASAANMPSSAAKVATAELGVHYTCFVRLPFPRGDFVDPPLVEWDAVKDRALWKLISKSSTKELDWEELSSRFDVSLPFLLQQAAWLYERHFAQMKAQMKKLSPSTSSSPIPPDSASNIGTPTTGPFPPAVRAPSSLSVRTRDSPTPTAGSGRSGMIKPPSAFSGSYQASQTAPQSGVSRTPSTRTLTQSKAAMPPPSPIQPSNRSFRSSFGSTRRVEPAPQEADYDSPSMASSSSDSSSDEDGGSQSLARSQAFRRPPVRLHSRHLGALPPEQDADDEDDEGGYLPFATQHDDPAATLTSPPQARHEHYQQQHHHHHHQHQHQHQHRLRPARPQPDSSTSSASSAAAPLAVDRGYGARAQAPGADTLSPRRRVGVNTMSPHAVRREESEGTPSMGSSFSDLDDASISQSALEDAYLSNMQRAGTASRMSTISQALRSKYL